MNIITIYIEKILLFNLLLHLIFIFTVKYLTAYKISWKRILISSLLDNIFMVLYIYYPDRLEIFKYFFGIILILVLFKVPFKKLFLPCFYYYMLNFLLGGVSRILYIASNYYEIAILVVSLILGLFLLIAHLKKQDNRYYTMEIEYADKIIRISSFYDTGAKIYAEFKPVILLNEKFFEDLEKRGSIFVSTIHNQKELAYYKPQKITMYRRGIPLQLDCYIAFVPMEYDAITGLNL